MGNLVRNSVFRIKCGITGHEMIAKEEIVKVHISGKKFQRLSKEWISLSEDEQANRFVS